MQRENTMAEVTAGSRLAASISEEDEGESGEDGCKSLGEGEGEEICEDQEVAAVVTEGRPRQSAVGGECDSPVFFVDLNDEILSGLEAEEGLDLARIRRHRRRRRNSSGLAEAVQLKNAVVAQIRLLNSGGSSGAATPEPPPPAMLPLPPPITVVTPPKAKTRVRKVAIPLLSVRAAAMVGFVRDEPVLWQPVLPFQHMNANNLKQQTFLGQVELISIHSSSWPTLPTLESFAKF